MELIFILFLYFFHSLIVLFTDLVCLMVEKSVAGSGNRKTSLERLQLTLFFVYWTCWKRNWHLQLCCIGHTSCRNEHLRTKVYRADFFLLSIKLKPNPTLPNFSFAGAPGDYNYRLGNRLEEVTFHWFLFDISQTNYIYVVSNGLLVGRLWVRF